MRCPVRLVYVIFFILLMARLAVAHCDFNSDGYDDFATNVASSVNIRYGRATGLTDTNNRVWTDGLGGQVLALSCGDFNGDHYSDLAIGNPMASVNDVHRAGQVVILYGTEFGLSLANPVTWTQASPGIEGAPETDDHFGWALASGDFNGDGFSDLGIGIPDEGLGDQKQAGAIEIMYGSSSGLSAE